MMPPEEIAVRYLQRYQAYLYDTSGFSNRGEEMLMGIARDLFSEGLEALLASGCERSMDGCARLRDALSSYPQDGWSLRYRICQDAQGRRLLGLVDPKTKYMLHGRPSGWPRLDIMADYMDTFARTAVPAILEGFFIVVRSTFGAPLTVSSLPVYLKQTTPILDRIRSRGIAGSGTREYIMRGLLERLWSWSCHYLRATDSGAVKGSMMTMDDLTGLLDTLQEPPSINPEQKGRGLVLSGIRGGVRYTFRQKDGDVVRMAATRPGYWPHSMAGTDSHLHMLPTWEEFLLLSDALAAAQELLGAAADEVVRDIKAKEMARRILNVTEKARGH